MFLPNQVPDSSGDDRGEHDDAYTTAAIGTTGEILARRIAGLGGRCRTGCLRLRIHLRQHACAKRIEPTLNGAKQLTRLGGYLAIQSNLIAHENDPLFVLALDPDIPYTVRKLCRPMN
jgi:hypothetical protein